MKRVFSYGNDEKGMTLFEVLISFLILLVCTHLFLLYLPFFQIDNTNRQEIQMFFQLVKEDMMHAYKIDVTEARIDITEDSGNRYTFLQSGNNVIRRKNGEGHEIALKNIKQFQGKKTSYGADIYVTDVHGVVWRQPIGFRPSLEKGERFWVKEELSCHSC